MQQKKENYLKMLQRENNQKCSKRKKNVEQGKQISIM
jgi:hypothetical protein